MKNLRFRAVHVYLHVQLVKTVAILTSAINTTIEINLAFGLEKLIWFVMFELTCKF